ncbi:hypothetical protein BJ508DRAFT_335656 [Ascobolus immersus RN42]|uniref:Uncharacterized protein n=1 Tax=Ascobolus immersus RN42 TaxID=1160509 RepID=A0A3N4HBN3_ASCIM|nr:hypothetical protein BJ508DRAFT_335656 [Ascobolus immersus RN42]
MLLFGQLLSNSFKAPQFRCEGITDIYFVATVSPEPEKSNARARSRSPLADNNPVSTTSEPVNTSTNLDTGLDQTVELTQMDVDAYTSSSFELGAISHVDGTDDEDNGDVSLMSLNTDNGVGDTSELFNHSAGNVSGGALLPIGHFNDSDSDADEHASLLVYEGTDAIQRAINEACTRAFDHSGRSSFRHDPRHQSVGNVFPREPVIGDRVELHYRLGDNGCMRIYCDYYGLDTHATLTFQVHTLGFLLSNDRYMRSLRAVCSNHNHHVVGEVVRVHHVDDIDAPIGTRGITFVVDWECGERCSFI